MEHSRALLLTLAVLAVTATAADRPKVLAHRGGAALRPENTIAAFHHALKLGVEVLEFDLNVTADGRLVLHHDSSVNARICRPVTGANVTAGPIGLLTLAQIRQFDCGSFARAGSPRYEAAPGQRMPTFDEFLAAVKSSRAVLLGEAKVVPEGAAYGVAPEKFAELIHAALRKHEVGDRFVLQATDYRISDALAKRDPKLKICLLNARRFKPDYLELARKHHATHMMLRAEDITAEQVRELQANHITVYSGTANTEADWRKYVDLGMDGILTDDPQSLIEFLEKAGRR